jgi:ADP-ribose pyrophosphatase YjhB (NUDIX family)
LSVRGPQDSSVPRWTTGDGGPRRARPRGGVRRVRRSDAAGPCRGRSRDGRGRTPDAGTNAPTTGEWFWPGDRLYRGERLDDAAHRIAREELGLEVELRGRLGVDEHVWETSAEGPSRHTVTVAYRARPQGDATPTLGDQYGDYRYVDAAEPDLHEYVRQYLCDLL